LFGSLSRVKFLPPQAFGCLLDIGGASYDPFNETPSMVVFLLRAGLSIRFCFCQFSVPLVDPIIIFLLIFFKLSFLFLVFVFFFVYSCFFSGWNLFLFECDLFIGIWCFCGIHCFWVVFYLLFSFTPLPGGV